VKEAWKVLGFRQTRELYRQIDCEIELQLDQPAAHERTEIIAPDEFLERRIHIINRTSVEDVVVEDTCADVGLRDLETGAVRRLSCRYLIGCDGARSVVRKAIGAELAGDAVVQRVQSTYIRAPRPYRSSALRARLGYRRHQPPARRHGVRDRWPRAMAGA
jgi:2-polyprenyl-6-methoxyphenol hydroxylase-like FAD-dependent oxidoreductase